MKSLSLIVYLEEEVGALQCERLIDDFVKHSVYRVDSCLDCDIMHDGVYLGGAHIQTGSPIHTKESSYLSGSHCVVSKSKVYHAEVGHH